jgi:hypothetical protein
MREKMSINSSTAKKLDKMQRVLELLATGLDRKTVASLVEYSNVSCLYRAFGEDYDWNGAIKNYVPKIKDKTFNKTDVVNPLKGRPSGKVGKIIADFATGMDLREVVAKHKFGSNDNLAEFMINHGYVWDRLINNYILKPHVIEGTQESTAESAIEVKTTESPSGELKTADGTSPSDGVKANGTITDEEFVELYLRNKESIDSRINQGGASNSSTFNTYRINKDYMYTTTLRVVDELYKLMGKYCKERGIQKQEFLQTAIIDTLKKGGYKDEVKYHFEV